MTYRGASLSRRNGFFISFGVSSAGASATDSAVSEGVLNNFSLRAVLFSDLRSRFVGVP
jgi:hypothetical protein